jgi:hypothetical protein
LRNAIEVASYRRAGWGRGAKYKDLLEKLKHSLSEPAWLHAAWVCTQLLFIFISSYIYLLLGLFLVENPENFLLIPALADPVPWGLPVFCVCVAQRTLA